MHEAATLSDRSLLGAEAGSGPAASSPTLIRSATQSNRLLPLLAVALAAGILLAKLVEWRSYARHER